MKYKKLPLPELRGVCPKNNHTRIAACSSLRFAVFEYGDFKAEGRFTVSSMIRLFRIKFSLRMILIIISIFACLFSFHMSRVEPYRLQQLALRQLSKERLPNGQTSITSARENMRFFITRGAVVRGTMPVSNLEQLAVETALGANSYLRIDSLDIRTNVESEEIVFVLRRMPFLQKLQFDSGRQISQDVIREIAMQDLLVVDLTDSGLSDSDVKELCRSETIEHLCLNDNLITDDVIEHFERMKNLKRLDIWWTNVSKEGVARLRKSRPDCEIYCLNGGNQQAGK